jgi:hypothetical protein
MKSNSRPLARKLVKLHSMAPKAAEAIEKMIDLILVDAKGLTESAPRKRAAAASRR